MTSKTQQVRDVVARKVASVAALLARHDSSATGDIAAIGRARGLPLDRMSPRAWAYIVPGEPMAKWQEKIVTDVLSVILPELVINSKRYAGANSGDKSLGRVVGAMMSGSGTNGSPLTSMRRIMDSPSITVAAPSIRRILSLASSQRYSLSYAKLANDLVSMYAYDKSAVSSRWIMDATTPTTPKENN